MSDKENRKKAKKINKELSSLKMMLKKLEIRPCQGDADLRKKDDDIRLLKLEILRIERDINQFSFL